MWFVDSLFMPHATTVLQFGAAALSLLASGLAVVQRLRSLRKRKAAGQAPDQDAQV
jgi:hypothetical protein